MVGFRGMRGRVGLTVRPAAPVVAKAPSPAEATQLVGQPRPCAIPP